MFLQLKSISNKIKLNLWFLCSHPFSPYHHQKPSWFSWMSRRARISKTSSRDCRCSHGFMGCWSLEKSYPIFGDLKKTKKNRSIQLPLCDVFLLLSLNLPLWGLIQKLIFVWIETCGWLGSAMTNASKIRAVSGTFCEDLPTSSIEFYWVLDDHVNDGPSSNSMKFDSGTEQILSENSITIITNHKTSQQQPAWQILSTRLKSPLRWRRLSSLHRLDRHGSYRPPAISSYLQLSQYDILQTQYLQPGKTTYLYSIWITEASSKILETKKIKKSSKFGSLGTVPFP